MKHLLVMMILTMMSWGAFAANVLWGVFAVDDRQGYYSVNYFSDTVTPEVCLVPTRGSGEVISSFTPISSINCGNSIAYWVLAHEGDVINESLLADSSMIADFWYESSEIDVGAPFRVSPMKDFYFAMMGKDVGWDVVTDDVAVRTYCAWVKLSVKGGELSVVDSALSYQSLAVGSYDPVGPFDPVPEPTAAGLLFVGWGMLMLRRVRKIWPPSRRLVLSAMRK